MKTVALFKLKLLDNAVTQYSCSTATPSFKQYFYEDKCFNLDICIRKGVCIMFDTIHLPNTVLMANRIII